MAKKTNSKNGGQRQKQAFAYSAPAASVVQLVGDFTEWQEHPIQLQKSPDGVWRTAVEMKPGTHHYRFLVDGQWQDDPDCAQRAPNPFGSQDMLRQVG